MSGRAIFDFESHLNTGLRGFPVGTCRTSKVDQQRASTVWIPIKDLAYLRS